MGKRRSSCDAATHRAWRLLRLALLWARKGSLLKARLMSELRHGAKYLKRLNHQSSTNTIHYGEKQLSFDETPVIHLKMSRPASLRFMIPCIKPEVVDFDYDFGNDHHDDSGYGWYDGGCRTSFLESGVGDHDDHKKVCDDDDDEEGIDERAEEFIAKFYGQMKLQREISFQRRCNNAAIEVL